MSDVAKLKKQLLKKMDATGAARQKLEEATDAFALAVAEQAVAKEAADQAEAMETALALRSGKKAAE